MILSSDWIFLLKSEKYWGFLKNIFLNQILRVFLYDTRLNIIEKAWKNMEHIKGKKHMENM